MTKIYYKLQYQQKFLKIFFLYINSNLLAYAKFPDYSNIIKSEFKASEQWTANVDCWIIGYLSYKTNQGANDTGILINGTYIASCYGSNTDMYSPVCIPVKKGTTVITTTNGIYGIKAYGI